jgi:hypothetical protein
VETDIPKVTTVIHEPCLVYAATCGDQVCVYRSPVVGEDSDIFGPVREVLSRPHRVEEFEVIEDENMMFGEGLLSVYRFTD